MMRFDRFTERAQEAAQRAADILQRYGHNQIDTEHILLALIEQPGGVIPQILEKLNLSAEALTERLDATLRASPKANIFVGGTGQIFITPRVKWVIDHANEEANRLKDEYISTEHIFLAILTERNTPAARILESSGLTRDRFYNVIIDLRGKQSTPQQYLRDLTQQTREGNFDSVFGRDKEVLRLIQILSSRSKNNPILVGEDDIGKNNILEELAQRIVNDDVPDFLSKASLISLDVNELKDKSQSSNEFEALFAKIITEVQSLEHDDILIINNMHVLFDRAAATLKMCDSFKALVMHGKPRIIGTATLDGFQKYLEKDFLLDRRFALILVEELKLGIDETIKVLHRLRGRYEEHHKVQITDAALSEAVRLAEHYVPHRHLPDKAIDLIDEAAAKVSLAFHSLPPELKEFKRKIDRLRSEEEQMGLKRDYERAAQKKAERLRLERDLDEKCKKWKDERQLNNIVDTVDVIEIIHQWTGVPTDQIVKNKPRPSQAEPSRIAHKKEAINYLDLNLKISPHERVGDYKVHIYQSPSGEASSEFAFPFSKVELENLILRLLKLRSTTRRIDSPEMSAARKLGTTLFQAVFQGETRDIFRNSLQKVRNEKSSGLRIKLRLQDVPELSNLPWEFLFDSDKQSFLAQSIQTPIIRYMELSEPTIPLKIVLPVHILGIISNPSNYATLDVQREKDSLQNALNPLVKAGFIIIDWLEEVTLDSLRKALGQKNYHILHFIGHGGLDQRIDQGVLVFTDNYGKGVWIDAERLGVLLYDHPSLRLVVLNACEGARNSVRDPFSGVATILVKRGIPAVVAMQFEISDTAAITFATDFYTSLVSGFPVDAAIAEARKAIYFLPNDVEWGTPVLYLRAPDGILFEFPKQKFP